MNLAIKYTTDRLDAKHNSASTNKYKATENNMFREADTRMSFHAY